MIELNHVIKKMAEMMEEEFKLDVWTVDTQEGFKPECFFIVPVTPRVERMGEHFFHDNFSIRVTFFPVDEHQINRLLEVKSKIRDLFSDGFFVTEEFYISPQEIQYDFTSIGNLEVFMDFESWQRRPEADQPLMEDLQIDFKEE